jgi:hypothetical protein
MIKIVDQQRRICCRSGRHVNGIKIGKVQDIADQCTHEP